MNQDILAFPAILDGIADATLALDQEWRFVYLNPAAEQLLGGPAGDLLGKICWEFFPELNQSRIHSECNRASAEQIPLQFEHFHPAKCNIWLEYHLHPSPAGLLVFLRDITQRKSARRFSVDAQKQRMEMALRLKNERLRERDLASRKRAEEALQRSDEELEFRIQTRTAELEATNASLRALGDNLPGVAIFQFLRTTAGEGRYTYLSRGFEEISGIAREETLNGGDLHQAVHPEDLPGLRQAKIESARTLSVYDVEARICTPTGQEKWMRWRAAPRQMENGDILWEGIMTDVTKRRTAEFALKEAHQALQVIKECGEAIAWASNETELLNNVCKTVLKIDDTLLAWIGFPQDDKEKPIRVMAHAGTDLEYINHLHLSWADQPTGRGPAGTSIRQREAIILHDLESAPEFEIWREEALKRGYASIIALPLMNDNHCLGNLSIYSSKVGAFHPEKVQLLKQLAGDISHGIVALRTRMEREQLGRELLRISEREKQLIAQELHDGLCQHLAGASLMASLLQRRLEQGGNAEAGYAKEVCDLLSTGLTEARNLSHGLHPIKPEGDGLMEALAQLAQTATRLFYTDCAFHCDEGVSVTDQLAVTHLFRIAQEALGNAIKHGRPTQVSLALRRTEANTILSIEDNGIGIPEDVTQTRGLGLQIMKHRAATIGASLDIRRTNGSGTIVTCTRPV